MTILYLRKSYSRDRHLYSWTGPEILEKKTIYNQHAKTRTSDKIHYFIIKIYFNTIHLIIFMAFVNFQTILLLFFSSQFYFFFAPYNVCFFCAWTHSTTERKLQCTTIYYKEIKIWTIWCLQYCGFVVDIINFILRNSSTPNYGCAPLFLLLMVLLFFLCVCVFICLLSFDLITILAPQRRRNRMNNSAI